jgi:hypothetical protein
VLIQFLNAAPMTWVSSDDWRVEIGKEKESLVVEYFIAQRDKLFPIDWLGEEVGDHFLGGGVNNVEASQFILFTQEEVFIVYVERSLRERLIVLDQSDSGEVVLM